MGKRTLAAVCLVLALVIVLAMGFLRVKTPHNIPFFVIYLVLIAAPVSPDDGGEQKAPGLEKSARSRYRR